MGPPLQRQAARGPDLLGEARSYYEERKPDSVELGVVLYRLACGRESLGDLSLALLLLEQALRIADRGAVPADLLRVRVYRRLASIHAQRHDLEAGREAAEKALELARQLEDRRTVAEAYWEAALLEERHRDFARATEYALRARDILADLGDRQETAKLLCDLGEIKTRMERPQEAVAHLEEGLDALKAVDDPVTRSSLLNELAEARLRLGETQRCLEAAAKSLAIMEGRENHAAVVGVSHLIRARALLQDGRPAEGRLELEAAKGQFESLEALRHLSGCLLVEGDLFLAEGRPQEAAQAFRRSSELMQALA